MMGDYYKSKESVEEYIKLAKDVSGVELIEKLKKVLSSGEVLELGSGPGTDWEILSKYYNTIGSDYSSEFLNHLRSAYPKGEFLEIDASSIETNKKFDGVYSNKVLHHLKNDEIIATVKRQAEVLKAKGIICHSFWKGEGSEIFKGLFVNYHSKTDLNDFFKDYFDIISIESYKEFDDDDSLLLIGRKK